MNQALQVTSSTGRTVLRFQLDGSPWAAIDQWAMAKGYARQPQAGDGERHRVYQKGRGFWVAPMMLDVAIDGNAVTLQAWVRMNLFVRLMALFILPAEMGIHSGGFRAVLPRKIARTAVNELLTDLGQPPIP
jgi:hypothetical protein